jgi:hypothetical protein
MWDLRYFEAMVNGILFNRQRARHADTISPIQRRESTDSGTLAFLLLIPESEALIREFVLDRNRIYLGVEWGVTNVPGKRRDTVLRGHSCQEGRSEAENRRFHFSR